MVITLGYEHLALFASFLVAGLLLGLAPVVVVSWVCNRLLSELAKERERSASLAKVILQPEMVDTAREANLAKHLVDVGEFDYRAPFKKPITQKRQPPPPPPKTQEEVDAASEKYRKMLGAVSMDEFGDEDLDEQGAENEFSEFESAYDYSPGSESNPSLPGLRL